MHAIAAVVLDKMEVRHAGLLNINDAEALQLAGVISEIAKLHNIAPNPYVLAYGNLIAVCGIVYGSRYAMLKQVQAAEREREIRANMPEVPTPPPGPQVSH